MIQEHGYSTLKTAANTIMSMLVDVIIILLTLPFVMLICISMGFIVCASLLSDCYETHRHDWRGQWKNAEQPTKPTSES